MTLRLILLVDLQQLLHARHFAVDDVVSEENPERLVADKRLGDEHGVPET